MKIAFASKDNEFINQHFGWCETFYIYDVTEDSSSFIEEVDSSLKFENESEKLGYKISCLQDSDIVYVLQIGPKASSMVQSANIYPMRATHENEKIEDVIQSIQKLMKDNAPLWLKRIMMKGM